MKEKSKPWHMEVLNLHNQYLFNNLIYEHNLITNTLKEVELSNNDETKVSRGFFAVKDKRKYFIPENIVNELPIKIGKDNSEFLYKEDVVIVPNSITKFKIISEHKISMRELIDTIAPFEHSNPNHFILLKIIAIASYICRTYICIATESSFIKSSFFELINGITDKCPVFKPRSIPGILQQINGTGNLVFDEIHDCKKEVKDIMEEISLQLGGGKPEYINGSLASNKTKSKYPCPMQSITYLYNDKDHYKNADKEYFDYIFTNNRAIDNRFLKIKLFGKLTEKFDRDFNLIKVAEANRSLYIQFAKELAYLQDLKQKSGYIRKYWPSKAILTLEGRRKQVFDEITWVLDQYCDSQEEYDKLYNLLEKSIIDYRKMLNEEETIIVEQEEVV